MKQADRTTWPLHRIKGLLAGVPFFNEVLRQDAQQFDVLLAHCEVLVAGPGETVIRQGDGDNCLYFLLRGQLAVMAEQPQQREQVLNYISPGEVFGTLAMLRETPRSATIRVDDATREAVLARIDYVFFSNISDFSVFSLETKLSFYHMLVHNIRWTLEVNRMQDPDHEVVSLLRKVPMFTGEKGTPAELEALHGQAHMLAELLCRWNETPAQGGAMQFT
ncbi:MAG: cyclic nucleotide-binding domain-containing protein [Alcanivorax sp.]|nr:cyclic nucleotide-binding domain-containing protein [Alcanivorax sp.]